ncbi:MAG: GNAT family N-acetyltransferase [Thermoplasmatota archaeon]
MAEATRPPKPTKGRWAVRRARPAEFGDVQALERAAFQGWRQASPASLRRSLSSRHQSVWVVDAPRNSPTRLAALLVLWHFPHRFRVYDVATLPAFRSQGLGRLLMAHGEGLARRAGADWMSLEADPKEPHLVNWYQRQGYAVVAKLPRYYPNGNAAVRMVKRL